MVKLLALPCFLLNSNYLDVTSFAMPVNRISYFLKWPVYALVLLSFNAAAQYSLKNLPEYSLPISNKKLVIAQCMTNIIRYKGHEIEDSCNPDY
jgi:hypothetical protein